MRFRPGAALRGDIEIFRAVLARPCDDDIATDSLILVKPGDDCWPVSTAPERVNPGEKWVSAFAGFDRSAETVAPKVRSDQRMELVVPQEKRAGFNAGSQVQIFVRGHGAGLVKSHSTRTALALQQCRALKAIRDKPSSSATTEAAASLGAGMCRCWLMGSAPLRGFQPNRARSSVPSPRYRLCYGFRWSLVLRFPYLEYGPCRYGFGICSRYGFRI